VLGLLAHQRALQDPAHPAVAARGRSSAVRWGLCLGCVRLVQSVRGCVEANSSCRHREVAACDYAHDLLPVWARGLSALCARARTWAWLWAAG